MGFFILSKSKDITKRRLSPELRQKLYIRFNKGDKKKSLAREFGMSPVAVCGVINKFKTYGVFADLPRSCRPRKTDRHQNLNILREIANSPTKTPQDSKLSLNLNVSTKIIKRRIKDRGLKARIAATVPYIDKRNMIENL